MFSKMIEALLVGSGLLVQLIVVAFWIGILVVLASLLGVGGVIWFLLLAAIVIGVCVLLQEYFH